MLDNALVDSLLHNLEYAVFHYGVAIDKTCPGGHNLRDKCIGAKGICDEIAGAVNQRPTNHVKGRKKHGIAVTNVGKRYRVVVTPR